MTPKAEVVLFPKRVRGPAQFKAWLASVGQTFQEHLGRQGLKLTRQREEILRVLMSAERHLGTEDLFALLKKQDPTIGRATVFRTVRLLQECGLVAEVGSSNGPSKFELKADRPHHDHMICVECGRILEFQSPAMEHFQDGAVRRHGFTALWHRHEIFGRCRSCLKRAPSKGTRDLTG
ncbi:MAG: transcriptional repressor [Candidatus Omnitrophica bacterium]|nr:transcriptional repressor [Candidatus Omnitrophota bacterium]